MFATSHKIVPISDPLMTADLRRAKHMRNTISKRTKICVEDKNTTEKVFQAEETVVSLATSTVEPSVILPAAHDMVRNAMP